MTDKLGPTHRFPEGKIAEDDDGEISIGITADPKTGNVVIAFGTPTAWIGMPPDMADQLADSIKRSAATLRELKAKR